MAVFGRRAASRTRADADRIAQWFAGSKGRRLLECERQLLSPQLARMFGSHALVYNGSVSQDWPDSVKRRVRIGQADLVQDICCNENSWPIQPDSVDVVLLQHSLEFADSAHDALREAAQSVRPGGHIVIMAINPYSFFALGRLPGKKPWHQARCYSGARISDWLTLLGFQVERCSYAGYRPLALTKEAGSLNILERFLHKRQWPLGNCYMLVARKMRPGCFLQRRRKSALEQLMPLPTAAASRSGTMDKQKTND